MLGTQVNSFHSDGTSGPDRTVHVFGKAKVATELSGNTRRELLRDINSEEIKHVE